MKSTSSVVSIAAPGRNRNLIEGGLVPIEASPWVDAFDAGDFIDDACTAKRLGSRASVLWIEWPNLRDAAENLVNYITPHFMGADGSLAAETVTRAVEAYGEAARSADRNAPLVEFMSTLAAAADRIMSVQAIAVGADGRLRYWDVWGLSLPQWLRSGEFPAFYLRDREPLLPREVRGARTALASRLVGHRELGLLLGESSSPLGAAR